MQHDERDAASHARLDELRGGPIEVGAEFEDDAGGVCINQRVHQGVEGSGLAVGRRPAGSGREYELAAVEKRRVLAPGYDVSPPNSPVEACLAGDELGRPSWRVPRFQGHR